MKRKNNKITIKNKKGSLLLETLVATLIFAFGVLSIMGLQSQAISFNSNSKYRADAAYLADQIVSQMWVDQTNLSSYASSNSKVAAWKDNIANTLPNGNGTIVINNGNIVSVTVNWQMPGSLAPSQYQTIATILQAE